VLAIACVALLSAGGRARIQEAARLALGAAETQDSGIDQPRPTRNGRRRDLWYPNDSVASARPPTESPRLPVLMSQRLPVTESPEAPVTRAPQLPVQPPVAPSRTPSLPGYFVINSRPWAMLSVDGHVVGNTPQLKISVNPGWHELVLTRDGFESYRTLVSVGAGATVRLTDISLKPIEP
jgi:PEGA domain